MLFRLLCELNLGCMTFIMYTFIVLLNSFPLTLCVCCDMHVVLGGCPRIDIIRMLVDVSTFACTRSRGVTPERKHSLPALQFYRY
jgi:hypothetical protein